MIVLTYTGKNYFATHTVLPKLADFEIRANGESWVYYHYSTKPAFAVLAAGTRVEAQRALQLLLITRRLTV